MNDGSADDSELLARQMAASDPRLRVISKKNGGLSSARNRGLDEARGHYIQFLDADDVILPRKFETQLHAIREARVGAQPVVVWCDYRNGSPENVYEPSANTPERLTPVLDIRHPAEELASRWETQLSIPCHCFLFSAELFRDPILRFDESLPNHEDWDCWMNVLRRRPAFLYADEVLALYRRHPFSMSQDRSRMGAGYIKAIKKQLRLWREDDAVSSRLLEKLHETKWRYQIFSPMERMRMKLGRLRRQMVGVL